MRWDTTPENAPMRPVLILQHLSGDGPAYLASWLQREGVPFEVRDAERGQAYPDHIDGYGTLAVLGGEMSANDELPHLRQAEALIREAVSRSVPTLGHCLGGQLMARALGPAVHASPLPEIGWQPIQVLENPQAQAWLGPAGARVVFQWHYEAFELPAGATLLASSAACPHQAFAIGPHLAMQFHVELDEEKLLRWSHESTAELPAGAAAASAQSGAGMRAGLPEHLAPQQALADWVYALWWAAARR